MQAKIVRSNSNAIVVNSDGREYTVNGKYLPSTEGLDIKIDIINNGAEKGKNKYLAGDICVDVREDNVRRQLEICQADSRYAGYIVRKHGIKKIQSYVFCEEEIPNVECPLRDLRTINLDYQVSSAARRWSLTPEKFHNTRAKLLTAASQRKLDDALAVYAGLMDAEQALKRLDPNKKLQRIEYEVIKSLHEVQVQGHSFAYMQDLAESVIDKVEKTHTILVVGVMRSMEERGILTIEKNEAVFLAKTRSMEVTTEKFFSSLNCEESLPSFRSYIERYEDNNNRFLTILQRKGVERAHKHRFSVITGGPGTGKSSVIDAIIQTAKMKKPDVDIRLCAPTAKAASRMTETTGIAAVTVHAILKANGEDFTIADGSLDPDYLIIDESSMLSLSQIAGIAKAVSPKTRIIFVGDENQLPSVDYGDVLHALKKLVPTTELLVSFRQQEGSTIIENAARIINGDPVVYDEKDFSFVNAPKHSIQKASICTYLKLVKEYGVANVMLISPERANPNTGCNAINREIEDFYSQNCTKRDSVMIDQKRYFVGDRVLIKKNSKKAVNGEVGRIDTIEPTVCINFGKRKVNFSIDELNNSIDLGWSFTIHASQGSEAKAVIIVCDPAHKHFTRRMLYTAVTRAKDKVVCVGVEEALYNAVIRNDLERRSGIVDIKEKDSTLPEYL